MSRQAKAARNKEIAQSVSFAHEKGQRYGADTMKPNKGLSQAKRERRAK